MLVVNFVKREKGITFALIIETSGRIDTCPRYVK